MIRLDTTTRKIQALLGGSVTTNQMQCVSAYSDATNSGYVGKTTVIDTNDTTAVDIVPAAAAGVRDVDYINIYNRDTVSQTLTVRYNDNGTTYGIIVVTLLTGEQLNYTHGTGWCAIDVNGNRKEAIGPVPSSSVTGTTTNNNAAAGYLGEFVDSSVTSVSVASASVTAMTSITLSAGDWDVTGTVNYNGGAGPTFFTMGVGTTSGSLTGSFGKDKIYSSLAGNAGSATIARLRASLTGSTIYYLNAQLNASGPQVCDGYITARRVR